MSDLHGGQDKSSHLRDLRNLSVGDLLREMYFVCPQFRNGYLNYFVRIRFDSDSDRFDTTEVRF